MAHVKSAAVKSVEAHVSGLLLMRWRRNEGRKDLIRDSRMNPKSKAYGSDFLGVPEAALWLAAGCGFGRSSAISRKISEHGDLGHLERDIARVADDLRTDLDQLFP